MMEWIGLLNLMPILWSMWDHAHTVHVPYEAREIFTGEFWGPTHNPKVQVLWKRVF